MKIGVYDRHWATGGGAERTAAAFATVLRGVGDVSMVGNEPIDRDWVAARFGVDLDGVDTMVLDDRIGALSEASASMDLLVNASFMSAETNRATHGIYYVHFPTRLDVAGPVTRSLRRGITRIRPGSVSLDWGDGFHHRDAGSRAPIWTDGCGTLEVHVDPGVEAKVRLVFGYQRPPGTMPTRVRVAVDGDAAAEIVLTPPTDPARRRLGQALEIPIVGRADEPIEVTVESDSFVPADVDGGSDRRRLGVPLKSVTVGSSRLDLLARVAPNLFAGPARARWLPSYDTVVANSHFTKHWVKEYWSADCGVLHPPVAQFASAAKEPLIVSVGRFFPEEMGHSKRQLEMVEAFRSLVADPTLAHWRLVLAGGVDESSTDYLAAVREAAAGLRIDVHANAPFSELESLYGRASIYWHAAGLGVDARRHPDRLEHFGITTAEAMSAGAVPVVVDLAGQREIVRHGVDGYRFRTVDDLASLTRHLITTEGQLERMSIAAARRAVTFGPEAFEAHVLELLAGIGTTR